MLSLSYLHSLYRASRIVKLGSLLALLSVIHCTGVIRDPAPGPTLPSLHFYQASQAILTETGDERSELVVGVVFDSKIQPGLRTRLMALMESKAANVDPLSPWPAKFVNLSTTDQLTSQFSHVIEFKPKNELVFATASIVQNGKVVKQLSQIELSFVEPTELDDNGFDFLISGQPLPLSNRPPARITDDTKRSISEFLGSLGMGRLRVFSSAKSDAYIIEESKGSTNLIQVGQTPVDLNLRIGIHEFLLKRKGQVDQKMTLRIADGEERAVVISWSDDADPGSVLVYSSPSGYRLALDGEIIGETPVAKPSVMAGVYELELAEAKSNDQGNHQVVVDDRLQIQSGKRSDRFYPFDYYLSPKGADLRSSLESGLLLYHSNDARFSVSNFDEPILENSAGIATVPIGSQNSQIEVILPPESASFGIYGEQDKLILEPYSTGIRLRLEQNGQNQVYNLERETDGQIYLFIEVNRQENQLSLKANGNTFYDGTFLAGQYLQLVSLGTTLGNRLPQEIKIRSESFRGGFFYKVGQSLWYRAKSLIGSKLQLKDSTKSGADQ
ncbi:MAG: PEGA domain-containing protein [Leptonema sp. (in: Bacteria)]|nr:PEGA domain-containing protein [Leptonema sp. (in: bacteria)]